MYARPSRHGWGPGPESEGRRSEAWDPLVKSGGSPGGAKGGGRGRPTADDGEDPSTAAAGHGIAGSVDAYMAAGEGAAGAAGSADAAEEFYSTRLDGGAGRGALGAVDVEEDLSGTHHELEREGWWAPSAAAGGTGIAPETPGVGGDVVPPPPGGGARDGAYDPMQQPSKGGGEGARGEMVAPGAAAASPAPAVAAEATEAATEGAAVPAPGTRPAAEDEHAGPPAAAAAAAAAAGAGDTMGEWFVPSQPQPPPPHQQGSDQRTATREHSGAAPAWKGQLNPDDGVEDGGEGGTVDRRSPGGHPGGAGSAGGGHAGELGTFSLEDEGRVPSSQDDQQQQQQQHGGGGVGHEAEGWDWADPWGQADTWDSPGNFGILLLVLVVSVSLPLFVVDVGGNLFFCECSRFSQGSLSATTQSKVCHFPAPPPR